MPAESPKPLKFGPRAWLRLYAGVIRQAGFRVALRSVRIQVEEKIVAHGLASTLRLTRIWYFLGALAIGQPGVGNEPNTRLTMR